jgi:Fic family protein
MIRGQQGVFTRQSVASEPFSAFVPAPLPPVPALDLSGDLGLMLSKADQMLGRLDGLSRILPHPDILIDFYIRKEAVLSSQIEGTQSTLTDLLLFEFQPDKSDEDTLEVSNYVQALRHGLLRLKEDFPLSLSLIREMHEILLQSGRGSRSTPGEFRTSQNWIGGSRPGNALFVPPPAVELRQGLNDWESFIHTAAERFPVLVQCALLHVQFETLHPFLDGNGRIGRLLITLLLVERGVLHQPLLYMSLYLKQHRDRYYDLLQQVRTGGDWEAWLAFFARGVISTAEKAVSLAKEILELFQRDELRLKSHAARVGSALQVLHQLQRTPYVSATRLSMQTGLSLNTVLSSLRTLEALEIVREMPSRRGKLVSYYNYLRLLDEGTVVV